MPQFFITNVKKRLAKRQTSVTYVTGAVNFV